MMKELNLNLTSSRSVIIHHSGTEVDGFDINMAI